MGAHKSKRKTEDSSGSKLNDHDKNLLVQEPLQTKTKSALKKISSKLRIKLYTGPTLEDTIIHVFFLIKNMQLLPELNTEIRNFYLLVNGEVMLLRFWLNNENLKKYCHIHKEIRSYWEINKDTYMQSVCYSVIQCKTKIGNHTRHVIFNCYTGGDIWMGISEFHKSIDPNNTVHKRADSPYMQGYGWWQHAAFTKYQNECTYKAHPFVIPETERIINLYIDPSTNSLYWIVDNKLLYTHIIDFAQNNIADMHLTMCIHNQGDRICIESAHIIPHATLLSVLEKTPLASEYVNSHS